MGAYERRIARRVSANLNKHGTPAIYRVVSYTPGPNPVTTYNDTAILVRVTSWPTQKIDGTLIQINDLRILISSDQLPSDPNIDDLIVINGEVFHVVMCAPIYGGASVAEWEVNARS